MELRRLNGEIFAAGQIGPGDVAELAAKGFRAIICNRPDGEGPGQPQFSEIEKAAEANGIKTAYQPVVPNDISDKDAAIFGQFLDELPQAGPRLLPQRHALHGALGFEPGRQASCQGYRRDRSRRWLRPEAVSAAAGEVACP